MTQLFANGFESGDFSSWTGNYYQNGTSQVQSSLVNSGSYAGQFTVTSSGGYADAYKDLGSSYTTVNQRFYVRFSALPASGQGVLLGFLANNSTNNTILGIGLRYSGGSAKWFVGYLKAGSYTLLYSSANTPQTNTWYCLEVKAVINSSSGTVEAWINGAKDNSLCDTSGFNNTAWGNINRAFVGQDSQTESTYSLTIYVDDVVVDESYIGPLGGSASKLVYTAGASQSVAAGSVSSVITVQVQDSSGNPVTTGATVGLSSSSTGGTFYSDSGGNTQITSIVISSGQSSGNCYYKDTTAGTPTLTASSSGLTSATTQFTINSSGSQYISSIAQGAPFTVASGALSLNVSSPLQVSNSSLGINASASPTFAGLTLNGMLNSNASGSSPAANSNAGMILDCYTPNHRDGLGIQSGGIWLKYDDSFNIYNDNGTTLLETVHIDNSGNMTITGAYNSNVSGSSPGPHSSAGLKLDLWPAAHSDGIGMQNGGMWLKYGGTFDIYYDNGATITDVLHLDNSGNMTFGGATILTGRTSAILSDLEIIAEIYGYYGYQNWQPYKNPRDDGVNQFLPTNVNLLNFADTSGKVSNLFAINSPDDGVNTLLATDSGFIVKKDIHAGGVLSCDQGAVLLGHGLINGHDPAKVSLTHSDAVWGSGSSFPTSAPNLFVGELFYLTAQYQGYSPGYYYYGSDSTWHVGSGTQNPLSPTPVDNQLFIRTDFSPNELYTYFRGSWVSLGGVENWNGGYDTLYVTRADGITPTKVNISSIVQTFTVSPNNSVNIGDLVAIDTTATYPGTAPDYAPPQNPLCRIVRTSSTTPAIIGVATASASQNGSVDVVTWGWAMVAADMAVTPGDRICASATMPGKASVFNGTSGTGIVIGKALTNSATRFGTTNVFSMLLSV